MIHLDIHDTIPMMQGETMERPKYQGGDVVEYVYQINVYVNELEKAAKNLRYAVQYAQECIPTDIPPFEQILADTKWIGGPNE